MNDFKIYAGPIENLSDARYFAARGVDVLIYRIDDNATNALSEHEYAAISDWVEVPGEILWYSGEQEDKIILEEVEYDLTEDLISRGNTKKMILDLHKYSALELEGQEDKIRDYAGVLLRGGAEERVGVKSFEELDDIMDILEKIKNPDSP